MIKALSGGEPHPNYDGWEGFLSECDLRDEADGVKFYGLANCNYVLFPTGELVQNFGYHGRVLMSNVRDHGWEKTLDSIKANIAKIKEWLP